jgi:hypothetical protein
MKKAVPFVHFLALMFLLTLPLSGQNTIDSGREIVAYHTGGVTVTIDGMDNESFWADIFEEFVEENWVNDDVIPATDFTGSFKVAYDDQGLYFFGYLQDDVFNLMKNTPSNQAWQHDSWELYFNPTGQVLNTDNSNYAIHYASQLTFPLGEAESNVIQGNSYTMDLGNHSVVWASSPSYDKIEIFIPWSEIMHPDSIAGDVFHISDLYSNWKFDVAYNDSDKSGVEGRDHQFGWNGDSQNWQNVSKYGTLTLDMPTSIRTMSRTNQQATIYPNPVKDKFSVTGVNVTGVKVHDITGSEVKVLSADNLNLAGLKAGAYFLVIETQEGTKLTRKAIKK